VTEPSDADLRALAATALAEHRAGRLASAERAYRTILDRDPDNARMMSNLGLLLSGQGAHDEAVALLSSAAAAEPDNAVTLAALARALVAAGQAAAAEGPLVRVAELRPGAPDAHVELARLRLSLGRPQDAVPDLERALAQAPDHLAARLNLAAACRRLGRVTEAEAHYRQGLTLDPGNAHALRNLRILLVDQARYADALEAAEAFPDGLGEGHLSRGVALRNLGREAEALEAFEAALAAGAAPHAVLAEQAVALAVLGRSAEALVALDRAAALAPADPDVRLRSAQVRLSLGDFAGGWRDYEARLGQPNEAADAWRRVFEPRLAVGLDPAQVNGRRVLVIGEQGIGDQVMFASMLPDLMRDAAEVACLCDRRLVRLFASSFPDLQVIGLDQPLPSPTDFDTLAPMGSLGLLYRNRPAEFPGMPYLRPQPQVVAHWAERLGPRETALRVGLSWRGGVSRTRTAMRSIPLARFAPILALPDCAFVSLQYGDARAEVEAVNGGLTRPIRLFGPSEIEDFEDLAGLVANLDVIVSVQTSLVHLSGAMGAAGLVMIPRQAEWRYGASGTTLPWYRSIQVFRQQDDQGWAPVLGEVEAELRTRLGRV